MDIGEVPLPLATYVAEMEKALASRLEYPALAIALALPDICATLETADCDTNKDLYAAWCDRWVTTSQQPDGDPGRFLTGAQLYNLRCAFLHNGSEDLNKPASVPAAVLRRYVVRRREESPGGGRIRIRDWAEGTMKTSAALICDDVARGVRAWARSVVNNEAVQRNLSTLLDLDAT